MLSLRYSWLHWVYAVVPILFGITVWDYYFNQGALKGILPQSPTGFFIFTVFFVQPHIMSSLISFFDTEYIKYYRYKLLWYTIIAFSLPWILIELFGQNMFNIVVILWTTLHVVGQQIGILGMVMRIKTWLFKTWKIVILTIFASRLLITLLPIEIVNKIMSSGLIGPFYLLLSISSFIVFLILFRQCPTKNGKLYLFLNFLMFMTVGFYNNHGYEFFSILVFRLVHDLTGFLFYMVHDHNRLLEKKGNWFYKPFSSIPFAVLIICPLVGVATAYPLTVNAGVPWIYNFMTGFIFLHYFTESFAWKNGSIHRKYISLK